MLRGKWTMLYVGDGLCDDRCRKALYLTRQSRIALNKDMDRVQRVFLVTQRCCDRGFLAAGASRPGGRAGGRPRRGRVARAIPGL